MGYPANKLSQETFLQRCEKVHGSFYDYSKTAYTRSKDKVRIGCPVHGEFEQNAGDHMRGQNCPKCMIERNSKRQRLSNLLSKEDFEKQAREVHGDFYDYSGVAITTKGGKIKIGCPIHGIFETVVRTHLKGHECGKCATEKLGKSRRKDVEWFLERSKAAHGNTYDYSKSNYTKSSEKLEVICGKHGSFWCTPANHYKGKGCKACADEALSEQRRMSEEEIHRKCLEAHGDLYRYLGFVGSYTNNLSKLRVHCQDHGEFQQGVGSHISGHGCPTCGNLRSGYLGSEDYCRKYPTTHLYLMRIENMWECYLKVGISVNPDRRAKEIRKELGEGASVKLLKYSQIKSEVATRLECTIHRSRLLPKYVPNNWFLGGTECYSLEAHELLDKAFTNLYNKYGGFNGEKV